MTYMTHMTHMIVTGGRDWGKYPFDKWGEKKKLSLNDMCCCSTIRMLLVRYNLLSLKVSDWISTEMSCGYLHLVLLSNIPP